MNDLGGYLAYFLGSSLCERGRIPLGTYRSAQYYLLPEPTISCLPQADASWPIWYVKVAEKLNQVRQRSVLGHA